MNVSTKEGYCTYHRVSVRPTHSTQWLWTSVINLGLYLQQNINQLSDICSFHIHNFWCLFSFLPSMLHNSEDACNPPAAGHDNSACRTAPLVVIWKWVVATKRLTDSLTVGVASSAFDAADALVVQHWVKSHATLSFQMVWVLWIEVRLSLRGWLCYIDFWGTSVSLAPGVDFFCCSFKLVQI